MRPISNQKRQDIISLTNSGLSIRKIAARTGVSSGCVHRWHNTLVPDAPREPPGRLKVLSDGNKRSIVRGITSGRCDTAVDVQKSLAANQSVFATA